MSTQITEDVKIESLRCSYLDCQNQLIPSQETFIYFFQKENDPFYPFDGEQMIQIQQQAQPPEIKFICFNCINQLRTAAVQPITHIVRNIHLDEKKYKITIHRDGRETQSPPKQGTFTEEKQYCKRCLDNQNYIKEFDEKIQKCSDLRMEEINEISKYYAEEQYQKDKLILQELKKKLNGSQQISTMDKLLILNKIRIIKEKYQ